LAALEGPTGVDTIGVGSCVAQEWRAEVGQAEENRMASTNTESCAKDDGPFRNERLSLGQTKAGTKSDSHSFHRQYMIHATMISLPAAPQHAPRKGARLLIARNFVFLSVGQVVVFSIGFITGIYSRRVLGVVAIGEVAWTMSVLSYFTLVNVM
jgi:hypothetical protein